MDRQLTLPVLRSCRLPALHPLLPVSSTCTLLHPLRHFGCLHKALEELAQTNQNHGWIMNLTTPNNHRAVELKPRLRRTQTNTRIPLRRRVSVVGMVCIGSSSRAAPQSSNTAPQTGTHLPEKIAKAQNVRTTKRVLSSKTIARTTKGGQGDRHVLPCVVPGCVTVT